MSRQPSVNANGNGPGSLVLYNPSKNTNARALFCSFHWNDGFHGPECQPRSSAVMIWSGSLQPASLPDGVWDLDHHSPVSGGAAPPLTPTRAKIASNESPR